MAYSVCSHLYYIYTIACLCKAWLCAKKRLPVHH